MSSINSDAAAGKEKKKNASLPNPEQTPFTIPPRAVYQRTIPHKLAGPDTIDKDGSTDEEEEEALEGRAFGYDRLRRRYQPHRIKSHSNPLVHRRSNDLRTKGGYKSRCTNQNSIVHSNVATVGSGSGSRRSSRRGIGSVVSKVIGHVLVQLLGGLGFATTTPSAAGSAALVSTSTPSNRLDNRLRLRLFSLGWSSNLVGSADRFSRWPQRTNQNGTYPMRSAKLVTEGSKTSSTCF